MKLSLNGPTWGFRENLVGVEHNYPVSGNWLQAGLTQETGWQTMNWFTNGMAKGKMYLKIAADSVSGFCKKWTSSGQSLLMGFRWRFVDKISTSFSSIFLCSTSTRSENEEILKLFSHQENKQNFSQSDLQWLRLRADPVRGLSTRRNLVSTFCSESRLPPTRETWRNNTC